MRRRPELRPGLIPTTSWAKVMYALLPVGHMGVLYYLSSIPGGDPRLEVGLPDYVLHAGAYALLAVLWFVALSRAWRLSQGSGTAIAWVLSVAYGIFDEVHQSFVPGRDSAISDLIADGLGAGGALLALAFARRGLARRGKTPKEPRGS